MRTSSDDNKPVQQHAAADAAIIRLTLSRSPAVWAHSWMTNLGLVRSLSDPTTTNKLPQLPPAWVVTA